MNEFVVIFFAFATLPSAVFDVNSVTNQQEQNENKPQEEKKNENKEPKNFILFLADDLGFGDLTSSGHPTSWTPNIDYLSQTGSTLSQFYITNPICSPSRASLLTGRYSTRYGVYPGTFTPSNYLGLPHSEVTIAEIFKNQTSHDYMTLMVGKWHLGVGFQREFLPTNQGFDSFLGLPYSHDMCDCKKCFPEGGECNLSCWEGYVSCALFNNSEIIEQPAYLPNLTEKFQQRALQFIEEANAQKKPFFLYYASHHIHHPQFAGFSSNEGNLRGATGLALTEMDETLGKIMKTLKDLRIENNTLTWFTSDNGPSLMRHQFGGSAGLFRCGKGTTWEGGVRVPSIIHWPTKIEAGRSNALSSSLDILPTISNMLQLNISSDLKLDGVDLSPVIYNPKLQSPREFMAIYPESPTNATSPFAVIYKNYKAHFYTKGSYLSDSSNYDHLCRDSHNLTLEDPPLLYNLDVDPGERYNLGNSSEYRLIMENITSWRDKHMSEMTWDIPRTEYYDSKAQPCCRSNSCSPFPGCCDCPTIMEKQIMSNGFSSNSISNYLDNLFHQ